MRFRTSLTTLVRATLTSIRVPPRRSERSSLTGQLLLIFYPLIITQNSMTRLALTDRRQRASRAPTPATPAGEGVVAGEAGGEGEYASYLPGGNRTVFA